MTNVLPALLTLSALLAGATPAQEALERGRLAFEQRRLDSAVEELERAVELAPKDAETHFWLGRALAASARTVESRLTQAARARGARIQFEKALELDPDHLPARLALVRFHLEAPGIVGGRRSEARRHARELEGRNVHAGHRAWAEIHQEEERWEAAAETWRAAIRTGPQEEEPYLRFAWMLQERKRFREAFRVLDQLLERRPDSALGLYETGRTAAFSGLRLEEGKKALDRFLGLQEPPPGPVPLPPPAPAHFHYGMIHRHEGENGLAAERFRRALAADPGHEEARRNLEELAG